MLIQLYPSLQFGWDIPQFETVVREYIKDDGGQEDDGQEDADQGEELPEPDEEEEEGTRS